ncbi:MAG: hypothetical protein ACLP19_13170 [Xanthobacteraceae bacterium]
MHRRWIEAALLVSLATIIAGPVSAQKAQQLAQQPSIMQEEQDTVPASPPPPAKPARSRKGKPAPAFEHDPDLDAQDQFSPSQIQQPMPDAVAMPSGGGRTGTHAAAHGTEAHGTEAHGTETHGTDAEPGAVVRPSRTVKPNIVACSGVFAKDSSHAKLAMAFQSRNVAYTQVDASSGSKVMASVIYAKDPKRRLEVWWSKPASKSDTHLIVINGQSDWIAPGELHLGLTLAELENLNGKSFKLSGFDMDRVATLSDWNGGTLSALAGGCKVGISLRADPKTPASALSDLPADRGFTSSDAPLRAANPTVSEILVAY